MRRSVSMSGRDKTGMRNSIIILFLPYASDIDVEYSRAIISLQGGDN